jgi:hypothetical protein
MNNERTDSFANRLAIAMQLNNINQIELSEKTKAFSKTISQSLINKYLKGKALARQDNIYILCKILNVDEAWMMGFDVPIERTPDELRTNNDIFQYTAIDSAMFPLLDVGDIAFIQKTSNYESGQTILFRLDNREYIRKVIDNNNILEFQAMNVYYPTIKLTKDEIKKKNFKVIGKVIKAENKSAFK